MPWIVAKDSGQADASTGSYVIDLPVTPAANDIILICATNDVGTTATAATGYTVIGTPAANQGVRQTWLGKISDGTETSVTVTGQNAGWCHTLYILRGADVSGTPWVASTRQDWVTSKYVDSASFDATSAGNYSLLFYSWAHDTATTQGALFWCSPSDLEVDATIVNLTSGIHHLCGHRTMATAGTAPTVRAYPPQDNDGGNGWVIAIKDAAAATTAPNAQPFYGDFLDILHIGGNMGRYLIQDGAGLTTFTATGSASTDVLTATGWTPVDGTQVYFRSFTGGGTGVFNTTDRFIVRDASGSTFKLTLTLAAAGAYGPALDLTTDLTSATLIIQTHKVLRPSAFAASINGITCNDTSNNYTWNTAYAGVASATADSIRSNASVAGEWCGQTYEFASSLDMSGDRLLSLDWQTDSGWSGSRQLVQGAILGISDGTNWKVFQLAKKSSAANGQRNVTTIDLQNGTAYASSGTVNLAAITKVLFAFHRGGSVATANLILIRCLAMVKKGTVIGGCSANPANGYSMAAALDNNGPFSHLLSYAGIAQSIDRYSYKIGNGSAITYWNSATASQENPDSFSVASTTRKRWNVPAGFTEIDLHPCAYCVFIADSAIFAGRNNQKFIINASANASFTRSLLGATFAGKQFNNDGNCNLSDAIIKSSPKMDGGTATYTRFTFFGSIATGSAALSLEGGGKALDCTFTKGAETYAIEIVGNGPIAIDLSSSTFSGYTKPLNLTGTTGTATITLALGQTVPTYDTAGITVQFDQVVPTVGLSFTSLVPGSQVVVYAAGTTTELFRDDNCSASESYTVSAVSQDVDYTIQKAGYTPIRVAGLTLTSVQGVPVAQEIDRAYVASSGLAYGTTATVNTGTKKFAVTTATTVQNWYSFMIESWIAQSALRNVAFPILPNGGNSFTLADGWEWFDSTSIDFLSRDGMRYLSVAGAVTAVYSAILSLGTAAGFTAEYQQVEGAAPTNAKATGVVDQLIQVYGDATHGNFDYRGYLVIKYQPNGYRPAEVDVPALYGTLADEFYIVSLAPTVISNITPGDPGVTGVTITNHGASPVSWDAGNGAKNYSITIEDTGTHTAQEIHEWVNYALSLDATFGGTDPFNWPEMILDTGSSHETARGKVIGSAGAALKGVRVIRTGGTPHPDFSRFQADDGTYGQPLAVNTASVPNLLSGTRVRVYNETAAVELANTVIGGGGYSIALTQGVNYTAGDVIRGVATYASGTVYKRPYTFSFTTTASTQTFVFADAQTNWAEPNALGLDWTTVTECSTDYVEVQVEVDDVDNLGYKQRYAIFITGALTEADGIRNWVTLTGTPVISWKDSANVTVDTTVSTITVINVKAASKLVVSDDFSFNWSDGVDHVDAVIGSSIVWRNPLEVAVTQGLDATLEGAYTAADLIKLMSSVLLGKSSGHPSSPVFRDVNDSANRVTGSVDVNGNRTTVTLNT